MSTIRATLPEARKYRELLDSLIVADGAAAARASNTTVYDASTMTAATGGKRHSTAASSPVPAILSPENIAARQEEKVQQLILKDVLHPEKSNNSNAVEYSATTPSSPSLLPPRPSIQGGANSLNVSGIGGLSPITGGGGRGGKVTALNPLSNSYSGPSSSVSAPAGQQQQLNHSYGGSNVGGYMRTLNNDRDPHARPGTSSGGIAAGGGHPLAFTASARAPFSGMSVYNRDAKEGGTTTYTNTRPSTQQGYGIGPSVNVPFASTRTLNGKSVQSVSANSILAHGGRPRNLPSLGGEGATPVGSSLSPYEAFAAAVSPNSVFGKNAVGTSSFASSSASPTRGGTGAAVGSASSASSLQDLLRDQRDVLGQQGEAYSDHRAAKQHYLAAMVPHTERPPKAVNTLQQRRVKAEAEAQAAAAKLARKRLRKKEKKLRRLAEEEEAAAAANATAADGEKDGDASSANAAVATASSPPAVVGVPSTATVKYSREFLINSQKSGQPPSYTEQFLGENVRRYRVERAGGTYGEEPYINYDDRAYRGGGGDHNAAALTATSTDASTSSSKAAKRSSSAAIVKGDAAFAVAISNPGKCSLKEMLGVRSAAETLGLTTASTAALLAGDDSDDDGNYDDVTSSEDETEREAAEAAAAEREAAAAAASVEEEEDYTPAAVDHSRLDDYINASNTSEKLKLRHFGVKESEGFVTTIFGYSPTRQRLPAHSPHASSPSNKQRKSVGFAGASSSSTSRPLRVLLEGALRPTNISLNTSGGGVTAMEEGRRYDTGPLVVGGGIPSDAVGRGGASPAAFAVTLHHKNTLEQPTHAVSVTADYLPPLKQPHPTIESALASRCPAIYTPPPTKKAAPAVAPNNSSGGGGVIAINPDNEADPSDIDGPFQRDTLSEDIINAYKSNRRRDQQQGAANRSNATINATSNNIADASSLAVDGNAADDEVGDEDVNVSAIAPRGSASVAITDVDQPIVVGDAAGTTSAAAGRNPSSSSVAIPSLVSNGDEVIGADDDREGLKSRGGGLGGSRSGYNHSTIDGKPRPTTSDDPFKVILDMSDAQSLRRGGGGDAEDDAFPRPPEGHADSALIAEDDDDDLSRPATSVANDTTTTHTTHAAIKKKLNFTGATTDADDTTVAATEHGAPVATIVTARGEGGIPTTAADDADDAVTAGGGGGADPSKPIMENHPDAARAPMPSLEHLNLMVTKHELEDELRQVTDVQRALLQSREAVTALRNESRGRQQAAIAALSAVEQQLQDEIVSAAPTYNAQRRLVEAEEKRNDPRRTIKAKTTSGAVWEGEHGRLDADLAANQAETNRIDTADTAEATREGYYQMRTQALRRLEQSIEPPTRDAIANAEDSAFNVLVAICKDVLLGETANRRTIVREQRDHLRSLLSTVAAERHRTECAVWMPSLLKPHERYDKHLLPANPLRPATVAAVGAHHGQQQGRVGALDVKAVSSSASPSQPAKASAAASQATTAATVVATEHQPPTASADSPQRPYTAVTIEEENAKRRKELFDAAAEAYRQRLRKGWDEEHADRELLLKLQRDKLQWKQEKRTLKRQFFDACAAAELLPSDIEMVGGEDSKATASIRAATPATPAAAAGGDVSLSADAWRSPPTPQNHHDQLDGSTARPATAVTEADDILMQWTTTSPSKGGDGSSANQLLAAPSAQQRAATPQTPVRGWRHSTLGAGADGSIPTTPRRQEVLRLRQRLEYVQWALDDVEQKEESLKKKIFTTTTAATAAKKAAEQQQ